MKLIFQIILMLGCVGLIPASDAQAPQGNTKLVAPMPVPGHWTMKITTLKEEGVSSIAQSPTNLQLIQRIVINTNTGRMTINEWSDGRKTGGYFIDPFLAYQTHPDEPAITVLSAERDSFAAVERDSHFPMFSWVEASLWRRQETLLGRLCDIYVQPTPNGKTVKAAIDVETKLPVRWEDSRRMIDFKFKPISLPPTITFPSLFENMVQKYANDLRDAEVDPGRDD